MDANVNMSKLNLQTKVTILSYIFYLGLGPQSVGRMLRDKSRFHNFAEAYKQFQESEEGQQKGVQPFADDHLKHLTLWLCNVWAANMGALVTMAGIGVTWNTNLISGNAEIFKARLLAMGLVEEVEQTYKDNIATVGQLKDAMENLQMQ